MLTVFISALLGTMAAQVAPGPNLLAVAGVALSQGRRPAFCVVWGVATGVLVWAAAFAFLLGSGFPPVAVLLSAGSPAAHKKAPRWGWDIAQPHMINSNKD
jgi:threonine/homoserine/homoserine lactone efflux protein